MDGDHWHTEYTWSLELIVTGSLPVIAFDCLLFHFLLCVIQTEDVIMLLL